MNLELTPVVQAYLDGLIAAINQGSDDLQRLHDAILVKRQQLEALAKEMTMATETIAAALGIAETDLVCIDGHAVIRRQ